MASHNGNDLTHYYAHLQHNAHLQEPALAKNWSKGVLWTLGLSLDRRSKKKLANALPSELAQDLTRAFWLLRFRDPNQTQHDFLKQVAKRSGHSDPQYARIPTRIVFQAVKEMAGNDVSHDVAAALAPEIRKLWEQA